MKRQSLIIFCLLTIFLAVGCARNVKEEKTAEQLADEGMKAFETRHFHQSIEAFKKLRDWYPFSKHALAADLKIADCYFEMENYEEAVIAYEEFERLHPRNEAIPFVIYRIGLCHYNRLATIDRDQAPARHALDAFYRLSRQFPGHEYAQKAVEPINKCRRSLAAHEFYVAEFYFKSKHYRAALNRFNNVVTMFPNVGDVEAAEKYIQICQQHLNEEETTVNEKTIDNNEDFLQNN
jgi:outer membrane protein assembly factor BamD